MRSTSSDNIFLSKAFETNIEKSALKPLPALRSDIQLLPVTYNDGGIPSWTLYDPVRGKYFRIGWVEFEILKRWDVGLSAEILRQVNQETTLRATATHVDELHRMLVENELLDVLSIDSISKLFQKNNTCPPSLFRRFFTFSLFYKKSLINPDCVLQKVDDLLQPVYRQKSFFYGVTLLLLLFVGFGLTTHAFELRDTFLQFMNPSGYMMFLVVLVLTNIIHEFGHGIVAKHYGCSVRNMGVALIFMLPVCYCDTTDAWKLRDSRQRLLINAGGIAAEFLLALIAGFMWLIFPDGIIKTLAFFVAVTSVGTTLLINLNPFLKFDGYYLVADALQIDNLQTKSFSTMRWQLRKWILGSQIAMPFRVSSRKKNVLCIYAASTWLYRIFLYQIIALMVYQFWFKALGILMMAGVIMTLLVKPVLKELVFYVKSVKEHGINLRTLISSGLIVGFISLLLVPMPRLLSAPAVFSASDVTRFYAPIASKVKAVHIQVGDKVRKGELLVQLENPELQYQRDLLLSEVELLQYQLSRQSDWSEILDENVTTQNHLNAKMAALADVEQSISQLKLVATAPGRIVSRPQWLRVGDWVAQNDVLAELANIRNPEIRAYVRAHDIDQIKHDNAKFITSTTNEQHAVDEIKISSQNIAVLTDESLAIINGGDIAVDKNSGGGLIPVQDWRQIKLLPTTHTIIDREKIGYVRFSTEPRSIASSAIRRTYGMLIRESGF